MVTVIDGIQRVMVSVMLLLLLCWLLSVRRGSVCMTHRMRVSARRCTHVMHGAAVSIGAGSAGKRLHAALLDAEYTALVWRMLLLSVMCMLLASLMWFFQFLYTFGWTKSARCKQDERAHETAQSEDHRDERDQQRPF